MNNQQFVYGTGDIMSVAGHKPKVVTVALLLIALDNEHPGFLDWMIRMCALVDHNFMMNSSAQEASHSMDAQKETQEWIKRYDAIASQIEMSDLQWED